MNDLKFALRQLWKNPGFTAVAVVTLALGIGANTAIFSIADAVLFRPIDLKDLDRLVSVSGANLQGTRLAEVISPADYFRFREGISAFEELALYQNAGFNLTGGQDPEAVGGCRTTPNLFRALDVSAKLGRTFLPEDGQPGREHVAILSDRLWKSSFGGDPGLVGKAIELDGVKHDVIGIMPAEANVPRGTELWVPLVLNEQMRNQHGGFYLRTIGRLKDGASRAQAETEAKAIAAGLQKEWPDSHTGRTARVDPLRDQWIGLQGPQMVAMLMGAVAFVLAIACVNVAILQLARMTSRSKERAIRAAIGASRARLISQGLAESLLLGLAGALLAILLAHWGVVAFKSDAPAELTLSFPNWHRMGINFPVLAFLVAAGILSGVAAGIIPAVLSTKLDLNESLKSGARGATGSRSHHRLKSVLIAAQLALAIVLLVGASLVVRGFQNIATPNAAIPAESILRVRMGLSTERYREAQTRLDFTRRFLEGIAALPEVEAAGLISNVPYSGDSTHWAFYVEGRPKPRPGELPTAQYQVLEGEYLDIMRMKLIAGRHLNAQDYASAPKVCLVSQALARKYFPGDDPLGKRIRFGEFEQDSEWRTIVGITADILSGWEARTPHPTFYLPFAQEIPGYFDILVKTKNRNPMALAGPIRGLANEIDPRLPLQGVMTLEHLFELSVFGIGYLGKLMALFGILALILSATGIYSVLAFAVAERTPEIAVRMVLGAERSNVLWLTLKRAVAMVAIGVPIGLLLAVALGHGIASLIYGVSATDPRAFAIAVGTLTATALLAGYLSARRALAIEPIEALRNQ